jgi:hypothetical protein
MARCREFCIAERVKCRELFLNNILYVDSALDLVQLTSSLLLPGKQACRGAFGRPAWRLLEHRSGSGRPSEDLGRGRWWSGDGVVKFTVFADVLLSLPYDALIGADHGRILFV